MLTGQWNPHVNPKDNLGFTSILTDDSATYPRMILKWYMSDDCPEPLNAEVYQQVMRENDERVFRAIWRRIHSRIY